MTKYTAWIDSISQIVFSGCYKIENKEVKLDKALDEITRLILDVKKKNGCVWLIGNGGSAALASHFSQDLLNKHSVKSTTLSDVSLLTCLSNDYGYDKAYKKALEVLADEGDLFVIISSSGNSENVNMCADFASERGIKLVALTSFGRDNKLFNKAAGVSIYIPTTEYGKAEIGHASLLHSVIDNLQCDN